MEIGGGSVRIHDATMQEFVFKEVLQVYEASMCPNSALISFFLAQRE
jgi:aspartyl-tRNA synthetase